MRLTDHTLQTNGIFEMRVKNAEGKEGTWTIDLKNTGSVYKGESKTKPNVTIITSDDVLQQLAQGKVRSGRSAAAVGVDASGNSLMPKTLT